MALRFAKLGVRKKTQLLFLLTLTLVGLGAAAMPGRAQVIISGTVSYSGAHKAVSSLLPIRTDLRTYPPSHGEPLAEAVVAWVWVAILSQCETCIHNSLPV